MLGVGVGVDVERARAQNFLRCNLVEPLNFLEIMNDTS